MIALVLVFTTWIPIDHEPRPEALSAIGVANSDREPVPTLEFMNSRNPANGSLPPLNSDKLIGDEIEDSEEDEGTFPGFDSPVDIPRFSTILRSLISSSPIDFLSSTPRSPRLRC